MVTNIRALGETVEEASVVKKLLRVAPTRFLQIASAIEQFRDVDTMFVEEVMGSLKAHEKRTHGQVENNERKLLLTEDEWKKREYNERKLLLTRVKWLKRKGKDVTQGNSEN